jgi:hypothetical protein
MSENPATKKETSGEWTMPEPVFRSSEGFSPKRDLTDDQTLGLVSEDEVPTEMIGFVDQDNSTDAHKQTVRVKEKNSRRHRKKKRSQSKLMTGLALAVGLLIGGLILAVIYFLFR